MQRVCSIATAIVLVLSLAASAPAGLVISQLNRPADLTLSGDIVYAVNFGNNGSPTVGGVLFSQDQAIPQVSLSASGEMIIPSWFGLYPDTGYSNLDTLLGGVAYTNNGPGTCITYVNAGALQTGTPYELQLILYEAQQIATRRLDITVEGVLIADDYFPLAAQGGIAGKGGSIAKYSFTAQDTVMNISITAVPNDGNHASGISAFVVTQVPEPATLLLFALGALSVRRQHR